MTRREMLRGGACAAALSAGAVLAGCAALPRSGPTTADMTGLDGDGETLDGLVTSLDARAASLTLRPRTTSFPSEFLSARPIDPTLLGVDDVLDISIWENRDAGLFAPQGGATMIDAVAIGADGAIFVPFAGQQRAAGMTLDQLRRRLRDALSPLTLQPQVDVRLRDPRSRLVSIQGAVARPGLYPIERATARLSDMLALAGGATDLPERVEVRLTRRGVQGAEVLSDVLDESRLDVSLRPGDRIVVNPLRERFVILGASGAQAEIVFPTRPLDLLSALGAARGLRDFDADPSGVFVLRFEDPSIADALLTEPAPPGLPERAGRPIVYRLDLTEPEGLFVARAFEMRDGDAIFVTNAPLTELRKFLQLFNSIVAPVNAIETSPAL